MPVDAFFFTDTTRFSSFILAGRKPSRIKVLRINEITF
jgi:hypothetical protein